MNPATESRIQDLAATRLKLIQTLLDHPSGLTWCEEHSRVADEIVLALAAEMGSALPYLAIVAIGGYGRNELAPNSDIDLTVIPEEEGSAGIDDAVRTFFRDLHQAFGSLCGLEVGYAYRLVGDAPGLDATTRTGLLDARLITGSPRLFRALQDALDESFSPGEFILEKIEERRRMFAKHHETPLVVEPHLKEGAGGMRCFHCANWLRTAIGEREARPHRSYDAVVRMRNVLQAVTKKKADELTRSRQQLVADVFGTNPFDMMAEHAGHALNVHQHYLRSVDKLHESRFRLSRGCLAIRGEARILSDADAGEAAVGIAIATKLGLRVPDIGSSCGSSVNGASAAYALTTGETTIRQIDRCGLLHRLLPELTACRTLIPRDSIHAYTVFEHSMRVVRAIDELEPQSFFGQLRDSLHDIEAIYLAALLHDVGKRISEEDHAAIGCEVAARVGKDWGLSPRVSETVQWLIEHHLATSHLMRFRDPAEPATAQEFAKLVGDQERLNMLCLLTYADITAVAEGIWTPAQDALLQELHARTSALLSEPGAIAAPATQRARLMRELTSAAVSPQEIEDFVSTLPVHYLASTPFEVVHVHVGMVAKARAGDATVDIVSRPEISASELTVCCLDSPGLLNHILGTIYALDLRVQSIRACTTSGQPVALDVFTVNFNGRPVPSATSAELVAELRAVLSGSRTIEALLRKHGKDPDREQRVLSYRYIEGLPGILEIRAPRARGLPFRLSRLVSRHGWNIQSARMGQWAENASAALYLTKADGSALTAAEIDAAMSDRQLST